MEYASTAELRRFEMKGYETMLSRLLDAPLQSSQKNNNLELHDKLAKIKTKLAQQTTNQQKAIENG